MILSEDEAKELNKLVLDSYAALSLLKSLRKLPEEGNAYSQFKDNIRGIEEMLACAQVVSISEAQQASDAKSDCEKMEEAINSINKVVSVSKRMAHLDFNQ